MRLRLQPGLPGQAIRLGETFGRLMNYGDGLYAGQFMSCMYSEAFFESDPKKLVEAIKAGEWDTVLGKLSFDAKGDIKLLDYVVYKWDAKGNYAELPKGS